MSYRFRREGRKSLKRRYGRSGGFAPIDPAGGYSQVQRMMKVYVPLAGLGEYVPNSALPTGKLAAPGDGMWSLYARPIHGGKSTYHEVPNSLLRRVYARRAAS